MMEEDYLPELPQGWVWTRLGEIAERLQAGGTPSTKVGKFYEDGNIPFVKIQDMVDVRKYLYQTSTMITEEGLKNSSAWLVPENSLLYSMYASYGIPVISKVKMATNQAIIVFIPQKDLVFLDYMFYYLLNIKPFLRMDIRGTTQENLNAAIVNSFQIPLPPLPEQHRIVSKIEELFTNLDAGIEALKNVKRQLKFYRQAVLRYAFEGKLTEEWREMHKDELEPASVLLERIERNKGKKDERREDREESLELSKMDLKDIRELPSEWALTRLGEVTESMKNGIYKAKRFYNEDGTACLRMYNIGGGSIVWKDIKRIRLTSEEVQEYGLMPGDLLVNRVNSRELVGKTAAIPSGLETCVYESKNIRLRLFLDYAESKYVNYWFLNFAQKYFSHNTQQTVGMASINQKQLSYMPIPIPSIVEQCRLVEEIEQLFSVADEMRRAIENAIKQAERLRQSILKKAFEGKLVPQDPSDERASMLLERIKTEKARNKPHKEQTKSGRKKEFTQKRLIDYGK